MSQNSVLVRSVRIIALLTGLAVLMLSVVTSVLAARAKDLAALDQRLTTEVDQQAGALSDYFDRARTVNLLLAHNPVFSDFYAAPGSDQAKIDAGGPLIHRLNTALAYLEQLFPGRIAEACLIDRSGAEIARVVHGVAASAAELSPDETTNPFFAPTLALAEGQVHQARAYVSPDTGEWVISNSTVISFPTGRSAIVHFEVALDSFRMAAPVHDNDDAVSIVDATSGSILVDSRNPQPEGTELGRPGDRFLADLVRRSDADGAATIGGRRVSYRRLTSAPGNANTWYVVVSAPRLGAGWTHGLGVGSLAMMLAALLTIAVAGASLRSYQRSLRRSALHDALTGLPNRTLLIDRLEQALRGTERNGGHSAVMIIDLDRFKEVNDTLGHHYGDLLLKQVSERMRLTVRSIDTVARLGGDEFAVVMPSIADQAAAQAVAERLLNVLHDTFVVETLALDVEVSIGMAIAPDHGRDATELLRHADLAMYVAKEHKSGCVLYDAARIDQAPTRLALLGDLRRALESSEQITLHYQPKVDLALGQLVGVEALIRWNHPVRGMLPPSEFIPTAESTALIQRLTFHVLEMALTQLRTWLDAGIELPIAVNLSTRCLLDTAFPCKVFDMLARHQLPATLLHLEITESTIMADPGRALTVLHALHTGGIRLSIDDFGTGYSSMAYLKQLPVDEIKVDRSFVTDMTGDTDDAVLVRSAIDLGHNLGLAVVAEGVEDEDVLIALRDLGCDIAQGYHIARPMDADQFQDWLQARPQHFIGHSTGAAEKSVTTGHVGKS